MGIKESTLAYLSSQGRGEEIAHYTAATYSHILCGEGEVSGKEFAERIRSRYLMTERRHIICADSAERWIRSIEFSAGRGVRTEYVNQTS